MLRVPIKYITKIEKDTISLLIGFLSVGFILGISNGYARQVKLGAFLGTNTPTGEDVREFESLIGHHIYSVLIYRGLDPFLGMRPSDISGTLQEIKYHDGYDTKAGVHIVLEPWHSLVEVATGKRDNEYRNIAQQVKQWDGEVKIRFAHEMIADDDPNTYNWYPWQDDPVAYKRAWRRVVDIFREEGATNVEFVWCPNQHLADYKILSKYYPGKDYVDMIGIDGWGYPGEDFDRVFEQIYKAIVEHPEIFGDKDIMLGEFAAMEFWGKAAWIQDAFNKIKDKYTKITEIYWFNINKEQDWRVNSSKAALEAFRKAISDPTFIGHPVKGGGNNNNVTGPQLPQDTVTLEIRAHIPEVNMMKVVINKVDNGKYWSQTDCMDFGQLYYDKRNGIFRSSVYFVVDVGVVVNSGNWMIIHQPTPIIGPEGKRLDDHISVIFVDKEKSEERVIQRSSYGRSYFVFHSAEVSTGWLRIYYGVATGKGDASGVSPITMSMPAGRYTGRVVLSLVVK